MGEGRERGRLTSSRTPFSIFCIVQRWENSSDVDWWMGLCVCVCVCKWFHKETLQQGMVTLSLWGKNLQEVLSECLLEKTAIEI